MTNDNLDISNLNIDDIIAENNRRNSALAGDYDPLTGIGCVGNRIKIAAASTKPRKPRTKKPKNSATPSKKKTPAPTQSIHDDSEVTSINPKSAASQSTEHSDLQRVTSPDSPKSPNPTAPKRPRTPRAKRLPLPIDQPINVPAEMLDDSDFAAIKTKNDFDRVRCRHDFEFWAIRCAKIRDKSTGRLIPFKLNAPQRKLLTVMERQRLAGKPIRVILLKARQWGGSTLVQLYMAWIQTTHRRNWNSVICAHVKDTAAGIRGMYSTLLNNYPEELWEEDCKPEFKSFERALNIREIAGRGCRVTLASSERQDSVRGNYFAMAHLSEVAFWKCSQQSKPEDFVRAICAAVNNQPLTLTVMESTANGVGNYFHREWLRAERGESDKEAIFIPWYEIEIYRRDVDDPKALVASLDSYERNLWQRGLTLEMIAWYHYKRREYQSHRQMQSEYPTDPVEAFTSTDSAVFDSSAVERLRLGVKPPVNIGDIVGDALTGSAALRNVRWVDNANGYMMLWSPPQPYMLHRRYIVTVDIGGRSGKSDWSVVAVFDRYGGSDGATPELVAQWRGHVDHDILAWKAAAIASWYGNALLVFESNTMERENCDADPAGYILEQVRDYYSNLYHRLAGDGNTYRIGFHTNRSTKGQIIYRLVAAVRDDEYIERDDRAVNELLTYRHNADGSYAACDGCHDDLLMTRAIALHVIANDPAPASLAAAHRADADLRSFISRRCR